MVLKRAEVEAGQGPHPVRGILPGCAHGEVFAPGFRGRTPTHLPFSFLGAAFCGGGCWPGAQRSGSCAHLPGGSVAAEQQLRVALRTRKKPAAGSTRCLLEEEGGGPHPCPGVWALLGPPAAGFWWLVHAVLSALSSLMVHWKNVFSSRCKRLLPLWPPAAAGGHSRGVACPGSPGWRLGPHYHPPRPGPLLTGYLSGACQEARAGLLAPIPRQPGSGEHVHWPGLGPS